MLPEIRGKKLYFSEYITTIESILNIKKNVYIPHLLRIKVEEWENHYVP